MPTFLTPPNLPSENYSRILEMPNDKLWLGVFNKALLETVYTWNWKQVNDGDLTPDEAVEKCWEILWAYWNSENSEMVETPFYDDEENVGDEEILGEQTWYDSLSDWIISGFLAISFTPAAAIAYNATIPRIRLALKTGNAGTIVRVIFGAVDVLYDTYSPTEEIVYLDLEYGETSGFASFALDAVYPLRVEHTGTHNVDAVPTADGYYAQVVKGDLRPLMPVLIDVRQNEANPCVLEKRVDGGAYEPFANLQACPPILEYIDGVLNTSPLGGESTPVSSGLYDPLYTTPPTPRPRSEPPDGKRCSAARSAVIAYTHLATLTETIIATNSINAFGMAGSMAGMLQTQLNFFMAGSFFDSVSSNLSFQLNATSYFTTLVLNAVAAGKSPSQYFADEVQYSIPAVRDAIQCALYCSMDALGQVGYVEAIDALEADTSVPSPFVSFVELIGEGGLNAAISANAASVEDGECAECGCPFEWCHEFDFTVDNGDFSTGTGTGGWIGDDALYSVGTGWYANVNRTRPAFSDSYSSLIIFRLLPATIYTSITIEGTVEFGQQDAYTQSITMKWEGSPPTILDTQTVDGAITMSWSDPAGQFFAASNFIVEGNIGYNNTGGLAGGSATITKITVCGLGDNPF